MALKGMKSPDPTQSEHQSRLPRVSCILAENQSVAKSWTGTDGGRRSQEEGTAVQRPWGRKELSETRFLLD